MKANTIFGLILLFALSVSANYAQEFTLTATAANTVASKVIIDMPALNGKPNAIILATKIGTLDPFPIGAWYYNNQWNIFNINHNNMPIGSTFKVQVFPTRDADHYLHVVATANNQTVPRTALNHPALDFHPGAQVKIFQNHDPYTRNPSEAKVYFDTAAKKWFIENVDGTPLKSNTAYNVVIAAGAIGTNPNTTTPIAEATPKNLTPVSPTSTTPTGNAGGDLNGNYPNPNVIGLNGRPLSNKTPVVGDILRWNGTVWEPYTINSGTGLTEATRYNAGAGLSLNGTTFSAQNTAKMWNANQIAGGNISTTPPIKDQVLKWNGTEWSPATPPVKTYFKVGDPNVTGVNYTLLDDSNPERNIASLSHSIELKEKSRLIISAAVTVRNKYCPLANCHHGVGRFFLMIDNIEATESSSPFFADYELGVSPNISGYMIDLNPGTHIIQFLVRHAPGTSSIQTFGRYSSIMVIPIE